MTKPTIINNVDVAECEYWKNYCRISALPDFPGHICEVNPNCYYKQLQRIKSDKKYIYEIAQKLRTKTDYHSPDEVNADIDEILRVTKDV